MKESTVLSGVGVRINGLYVERLDLANKYNLETFKAIKHCVPICLNHGEEKNCDMKTNVPMMGLYECYMTSYHQWACLWCLCTADELKNFEKEGWPLRDLDTHEKLGTKADNLDETLIKLPWTRRPPCNLHTVQALIKLIIELLIKEAETSSIRDSKSKKILLLNTLIKQLKSWKLKLNKHS